MNRNVLLVAAAVAVSAVASAQKLSVNGVVTGLDEGTWIYLRLSNPDIKLDSARIRSGKFHLEATLHEEADKVVLYTPGYKDYVFFWAENKPMQVSLRAGAFKSGAIAGSSLNDEEHALDKAVAPYSGRRDSSERNAYAAYISAHPGSLVSANVLDIYATTWGKTIVAPLYAALSDEMKASRYGRNIHDYLLLNKNLKVGDHFEDFEQQTPAGKALRLSAVKGKYVLLEFWASWCGPCREDNPGLVKIYDDYHPKGFEIVGVSLDNNGASWRAAIQSDKLAWQHVSDLNGDKNRAALMYGIHAIPMNFLIDEHGTIVGQNLRGDALRKKLAELL